MGGGVGGGPWPLSVASSGIDRPVPGTLRTGAGGAVCDPPRTDEFSSDDKTLTAELALGAETAGAAGGAGAAVIIMSKKAPREGAELAEDKGFCRSLADC